MSFEFESINFSTAASISCDRDGVERRCDKALAGVHGSVDVVHGVVVQGLVVDGSQIGGVGLHGLQPTGF